jgi:beta-galactosidase
MNDFQIPLRAPNHPMYLNTEFIGHMYPTKRNDNIERITEHTMRHARVHNQLASDKRYAGGLGWCAFDYNTHAYFCSGDRVCYHGVADIFRIPKPAAGFYKSQCAPEEEIVFGNLEHPPFVTNIREGLRGGWGDLRIDGFVGGKKVISKTMSGRGVDRQFHVEPDHVEPDDTELVGDGIDATRVVFRVTDEFGAARPFATAAIAMTIEGPGEIIGENPFALFGGVGAVWVKAKERAGIIALSARHPTLGAKTIQLRVRPRGRGLA